VNAFVDLVPMNVMIDKQAIMNEWNELNWKYMKNIYNKCDPFLHQYLYPVNLLKLVNPTQALCTMCVCKQCKSKQMQSVQFLALSLDIVFILILNCKLYLFVYFKIHKC
jgi:hypothetical protein